MCPLLVGIGTRFLSVTRTPLRKKKRSDREWIDDPMADLPYFSTLRDFEESGRILTRENIYGNGPPSPIVSEETLSYVKKYAGKHVLDIGCGIGAYIKALLQNDYECEGIENNQDYVSECLKDGIKVKYMDAQQLEFS